MGRISPKRALCTSVGIAATASLALLLASPAVHAGVSNTASYGYKVIRFDYQASGQLTGGRFQSQCTPVEDALWEGDVTTAETDLSPLGKLGDASVNVHRHGTSGEIDAKTMVESKFKAFHRETTACENESETNASTSNCTDALESDVGANVEITGGVGNRVKLTWWFSIDPISGTELVPNSFSCVEPFKFPYGTPRNCTQTVGLGKFAGKTVKLPFNCFFTTSAPPPGTNYTKYAAVASAKGSLLLKRTKQH